MSATPRTRRSGLGALILGAILLFIGGYYVLRNTLGMDVPELDGNKLAPVIAVLIGFALLYRAWDDRRAR